MRLTILALTLFPVAVHAQNTIVTPTEPLAQSQTCPVGMAWDAAAGTCATLDKAGSPLDGLQEKSGCSYGAPREVTS